jgi:DNA-binding NarL/FixJ family response regulator
MMNSISVMLVDVAPILRRIAMCFTRACWEAEAAVVGTVVCSVDAAATGRALQPDIVLMDLGLSDPHALKALQRLRRALRTASIFALGRRNLARQHHTAEQAGVDESAVKADVPDELMPAIRRVVCVVPPQRGAAERTVAGEPVPLRTWYQVIRLATLLQ